MGNGSSNINVFSRNINNSNINRLVRQYVEDRNNLPSWLRGIPIGDWDVSRVTNMFALFANIHNFNEPLNNWNVSNVTTMYHMFNGCTNFNQPLDNWNVSNVTDMYCMFNRCINFNQPLDNWNVSNVTDMTGMFRNCTNFNQPLGNWNVSNVIDMRNMFQGCTNFNQDLSNWNMSNVRNVTDMFRSCINLNINPNWQLHRSAHGSASMFDNTSLQQGRQQQERQQPRQQLPRGLAYEIHNAFPELNFNKFMTIVTRDNNGASNFKDAMYPLQPLITYINTDTNTTLDATEKTGLINDLNGEIKTRLNMYLSQHPETRDNVMEMIQFIMSQGSDYKDPYIRFLTYDCMNAYGPGGASCTKGVFERVFLINKSVLIPLCSDNTNSASSITTCKQVYRDLLGCFYPDLDLNALFGEWYNINNLEEGSTSPLANASEEERQQDFRRFVLNKVPRADPTSINNYIEKNKNTFKTLLIGGRRKRQSKRVRKTVKRRNSRKLKTFKKHKNRTNKK